MALADAANAEREITLEDVTRLGELIRSPTGALTLLAALEVLDLAEGIAPSRSVLDMSEQEAEMALERRGHG